MEKLFWTIFLSLLVACGKETPPEDFGETLARNGAVNGAPWPQVKITSAKTMRKEGLVESKLEQTYERESAKIYKSLKGQYKNIGLNYQASDLMFNVLVNIEPSQDSTIYLSVSNLERLKNVKISVANSERPESKIFLELDPSVSPAQISGDFSALSKAPFLALIKIEDFQFNEGNKIYQYQGVRERVKREQYRLILDNGWKKETFYIAAGRSLEEAFQQYQIDYQMDRVNELVSLDGKESEDWDQDLNKLPADSYFWKVFNTPDQKITNRPIAGQDILVKRIHLGKLREVAAKRRQRTLKITAPIVPAVTDPLVTARRIKSVSATLLAPKQKVKGKFILCGSLSFKSAGGSIKNNDPKGLAIYSLVYERIKLQTPAYLFSEVGLGSMSIDSSRPLVKVVTGQRFNGDNKRCKNIKDTTVTKNYPHKYEVSIVVEETLKL